MKFERKHASFSWLGNSLREKLTCQYAEGQITCLQESYLRFAELKRGNLGITVKRPRKSPWLHGAEMECSFAEEMPISSFAAAKQASVAIAEREQIQPE